MVSEIVPIVPGIQIWQLRALWSYSSFALSESSWSFADIVGIPDGAFLLYEDWVNFIEPLYCAARPDEWELDWVLVEDRYPAVRPPLVINYIPGQRPDSSGQGCPPQVSGLVSWRTGVPGRSFRGRTFWGPVRVDDMESDGFIGGDARSAMYDFAETMLELFNAGPPGLRPRFAIVSRTENGAPRVPPVFTTPEVHIELRYAKTIRKRNHSPNL
jgi:hypothetical protein